MMQNNERSSFCRLAVKILVDGYFKVDDFSTGFTDEMIVGLRIRFETVEGTAEVDFLYKTLFNERGKVSIHRSEAEIGEFILQFLV